MANPVWHTADQVLLNGSNASTAWDINKPANVAEGDLLVLVYNSYASIVGNGTALTTVPSGWTMVDYEQSDDGSAARPEVSIWYKVAGASEPASYTWAATGNTAGFTAINGRVTGFDSATPFGATKSKARGTLSTVDLSGFSAAGESLLLVGSALRGADGTSGRTYSATGFTVAATHTNTNYAWGAAGVKNHGAAGATGTITTTYTGSNQRIASLMVEILAEITRYIPDVEPLYYGAQLMESKTAIQFHVTAGHGSLNGAILGSGTNGTTDSFGNFVLPEAVTLSDQGEPVAENDPVTLHLYWEEGNPAVDRSLIVKTTLVEDV